MNSSSNFAKDTEMVVICVLMFLKSWDPSGIRTSLLNKKRGVSRSLFGGGFRPDNVKIGRFRSGFTSKSLKSTDKPITPHPGWIWSVLPSMTFEVSLRIISANKWTIIQCHAKYVWKWSHLGGFCDPVPISATLNGVFVDRVSHQNKVRPEDPITRT